MNAVHIAATLLSTTSIVPFVVVFLDLEKGYDLASPLAIQETLNQKGIRGKLLPWIGTYFRSRAAKVRFQDYLPKHK